MGALSPIRPAQAPKYSNLIGDFMGGKPLIPKRKGKSIFARSSVYSRISVLLRSRTTTMGINIAVSGDNVRRMVEGKMVEDKYECIVFKKSVANLVY